AAALLVVFLWPRLTTKVPGSLVAIVATTVVVQRLSLPVDTIGSRFGGVPSSLPAPHVPTVTFSFVPEMFPSAMTIALLAAKNSLLAAVVRDGMMGSRNRSNRVLIAQGVGNVRPPLSGGFPATGPFARTARNIKCGGRTPVAAIVH